MKRSEARLLNKWLRPLQHGLLLGLLTSVSGALAQTTLCATSGKDGVGTNLTGVVNTYYPGSGNASAGATTISVGTPTGASTAISAGDLLLVIQMQDATLNTSNTTAYGAGTTTASGATNIGAGKYEYVVARSAVSGSSVTVASLGSGGGLLNSYVSSAFGATGQKTFQVIRVPQYSSVTLGANLTARAWDGATGGVVAIDVSGSLSMNSGNINVSGLGFRGGAGRNLSGIGATATTATKNDFRNLSSLAVHAQKGEGLAGTPRYVNNGGTLLDTSVEGYPNGGSAQGAPGNAGGGGTDGNVAENDRNSGGGGGANGGTGGRGGNTWAGNDVTGGYGGSSVVASAAKLVMGGGGGAGSINSDLSSINGFYASGAAGGGMAFVRADTVTGAGVISANGNSASDLVANDGSGGGGAGGSVLVVAQSALPAGLTVNASGGKGGNNSGGGLGAPHGPGGGGSGGVVALSSNGPGVTVNGGLNGKTAGYTTGPTTIDYGATSGTSGQTFTNVTGIPGAQATALCKLLTITKVFSPTSIMVGNTTTLTLTVTNRNAAAVSALAITDNVGSTMGFPTPMNLRVTANTCGGTTSAAENTTGILALTGGSIAASTSCTVTVAFAPWNPPVGPATNTIPAANVMGTVSGAAITAATPASATLTVTAGNAGGVYVCDPNFYQTRQDPTTLLSNLYLQDLGNLSTGGVAQWSEGFGPALNALAYNPKDSYFYAVNIKPLNVGSPFRLYRLGKSGAVEYASLTNIPNTSDIAAATVDRDGMMYIKPLTSPNNATGGGNVVYRYNLVTNAPVADLSLNASVYLWDLAVNPLDNKLYGAFTPGAVYIIDPSTGAVTQRGNPAALTGTNPIGTLFFNQQGVLYAYQNGGAFGTINLTTGAFTQTATASAAAQSDGASCAFAPPLSITLLKLGRNSTQNTAFVNQIGTVGAKPGDTVEYCIVYTNTGGIAPNFKLTDNVPAGLNAVLDAYDATAPVKGVRWADDTVIAVGATAAPTGSNLTSTDTDSDKGSLTATGGTNSKGIMTLDLGTAGLAAGGKGTVCFQARVP